MKRIAKETSKQEKKDEKISKIQNNQEESLKNGEGESILPKDEEEKLIPKNQAQIVQSKPMKEWKTYHIVILPFDVEKEYKLQKSTVSEIQDKISQHFDGSILQKTTSFEIQVPKETFKVYQVLQNGLTLLSDDQIDQNKKVIVFIHQFFKNEVLDYFMANQQEESILRQNEILQGEIDDIMTSYLESSIESEAISSLCGKLQKRINAYRSYKEVRNIEYKIKVLLQEILEEVRPNNLYLENENEIDIFGKASKTDFDIVDASGKTFFIIETKRPIDRNGSVESILKGVSQNLNYLRNKCIMQQQEKLYGLVTNHEEWFLCKVEIRKEVVHACLTSKILDDRMKDELKGLENQEDIDRMWGNPFTMKKLDFEIIDKEAGKIVKSELGKLTHFLRQLFERIQNY